MTSPTKPQPPHDAAAEAMVLGCALLDAECWPTIAATVAESDFYRQPHRLIYAAMREMSATGTPFELVPLTRWLTELGKLQEIGGAAYLSEIVDMVVTSANIGYYLSQITQTAHLRRIIQAADLIRTTAMSPAADLQTVMAGAYGALDAVAQARTGSADSVLTLDQMAKLYTAHVSSLGKNRFITGYSSLDDVIKGVSPGETLFIAAYSGLGKSAFLHNLLLNACQRTDQHHLFFSMEMPATRVFERTVQISLGHFTYNIESEWHHHNAEKRAATMLQLSGVSADKLLCCELGGLSLEQVEHYTRLARSRHGKIGAIGLDYLGLMSAPGTRGEYERISAVAEGAKHLAKRLNIPVVVLVQISREAIRAGQMEMHSAKGSGAVEASADYMIGMEKKDGNVLVKILKNRNGEAGIIYRAGITWPFLRFDHLEPWDAKSAKEAQRGKERGARKAGVWTADEEDPYP